MWPRLEHSVLSGNAVTDLQLQKKRSFEKSECDSGLEGRHSPCRGRQAPEHCIMMNQRPERPTQVGCTHRILRCRPSGPLAIPGPHGPGTGCVGPSRPERKLACTRHIGSSEASFAVLRPAPETPVVSTPSEVFYAKRFVHGCPSKQ